MSEPRNSGSCGNDRLKIFSGSANRPLAEEVAECLGLELGRLELGRFSNGEVRVVIEESVRGDDVFVIQPTCQPANETLMELLILIDAFRRASARRITAVIPYYGYARQDRKTRGREPITAKLVANLLTVAGADRVLTMDLHAGQIQGFFDLPVDHLSAAPLIAEYLQERNLPRPVVVSPDPGGVPRARDLADRLGYPMAIIDKRRPAPNVAEVMNVIGEVEGCTAVVVDDMIDTGGTIVEAVHALLKRGAVRILACATHPVLSGQAPELLAQTPLEEVVVTNTIPVHPERLPKLKILSVAPLLAEAIMRIHEDLSVSALFT